jgi:hypothetical protein
MIGAIFITSYVSLILLVLLMIVASPAEASLRRLTERLGWTSWERKHEAINTVTAYVLAIAFFAAVLFGWRAVWIISKVGWNSGLIAYAVENDTDELIVPPTPHDCDFWEAPVGNKSCKYVASWRPEGRHKIWIAWYKQKSE